MEWIFQLDMSVLESIQGSLKNDIFDAVMPFVSFIGEYGAVWILCALMFLFFAKTRSIALGIAVALILSAIFCNLILKNVVMRTRPCDVKEGFELIVAHPTGYSFPSGHSTSSFAAATMIFASKRVLGIAALALAALIAFSRLYLFVHFPTDVLCGTVLGITCGICAAVIAKSVYPRILSRFAEK